MSTAKKAKVVQLAQARMRRDENLRDGSQEACFFYTLDLLMEDFGKKHDQEYCALCEPMKIMGMHRDEAVVKLGVTLFTSFFPVFEDYLIEIKETMVQNLLRRHQGPAYRNWQEKLRSLLRMQVQKDAQSFLEDIHKHLKKYCGVDIGEERREEWLKASLLCLEEDWIPEKFLH